MNNFTTTSNGIKVCVLAGGLGRRLWPLTETVPKPMAPVNGKPFLHKVLSHMAAQGFDRFVLAVGYLWEKIADHFGDGSRFGWRIEYSVEPRPMGTGGAVLWAQPAWGTEVLVINGDTHLQEDYRPMVELHRRQRLPATMALVRQEECSRFGKVGFRAGKVTAFCEKSCAHGPGWINAGVYLLSKRAFDGFDRGQAFSLEREVFPSLCPRIGAYLCNCRFDDIGTPESLEAYRDLVGVPGALHEP